MAKRIGEKAERVLKLLLGLRNRKIASALAARGFGAEDLDEGFALLRGVTDVSLAVLPPPNANPALVLDIDRWENEWFPVASATLARHHPEIHARVFLNLSQSQGPAVIISVGTFVRRIEALTKAEAGYGHAGKEARKLLHRRGITKLVIDEAKEMLAAVGTIEEEPEEPVDLDEEDARLSEAEDAMWAWYLEWSAIARAAIKERRLLRRLGFLSATSSTAGTSSAARDDDDELTPPAAPAA